MLTIDDKFELLGQYMNEFIDLTANAASAGESITKDSNSGVYYWSKGAICGFDKYNETLDRRELMRYLRIKNERLL